MPLARVVNCMAGWCPEPFWTGMRVRSTDGVWDGEGAPVGGLHPQPHPPPVAQPPEGKEG